MRKTAGYLIIDELSESHKKQLLGLYQNEWWSKSRTQQDVDQLLKGSSFIVGIVHKETSALVGFARVLTDYFKFSYVYDVIIHPSYRGRGLGEYLLEQILNHPVLKEIKSIELLCPHEMAPFYEKHGFSKDYGTSAPLRRLKPHLNW